MYAYIPELAADVSRGSPGRRVAIKFSRPTLIILPLANDSVPAPCSVVLATANLYSLLRYLVLAISCKAGQLSILRPDRSEDMRDSGYELRRIRLPRTR